MMRIAKLFPAVAAMQLLSGCVNLAPEHVDPALPIPVTLPGSSSESVRTELMRWDEMFSSPELKELTQLALDENRNLRVAVANVEVALAQYGVSRAGQFPTLSASGSATVSDTITGGASASSAAAYRDSAIAQLGISAYELDFFGRVKNLSDAALQSWLSTVEGERAARIAVAASVAEIWLQLAADREQLALAEETARTQGDSLNLTNELFRAGISNELDVRRASSSVETAKAQAATFRAQVLQDLNALRLVVGTDLPAGLMQRANLSPSLLPMDSVSGMSSEVLLNRPDIIAAEHSLLAANANIGAARAAMFPSISLTGNLGVSSAGLEDLFDDGVGFFSVGPQISLPIFDAGARRSQIDSTLATQKIALAQYELAIQTAFRETADALAVAETIGARIEALERLQEDSEVTLRLSEERFEVGIDDYLSVLDAQRAAFTARQQYILARRDQALNRVALYRAIGAAPEMVATANSN